MIGAKKPYNFIRLMIFIFVCSRLLIYHFVPFEVASGTDMHFLDPVILKTNLLQGLYYLHAQPPMFNLFLGILLKLDPYLSINFLAPAIYFCLGLFLCLGSFLLLKILGASEKLAFVGALAVMFFPSLIQSERWLEFFYPVTAGVLALALLVYYFVKTRRLSYFFWFFFIMAAMVLTWGFYHLLAWMIPLMVLAGLLVYKLNLPNKKYYFLIMLVFFLLGSSIYVKNYIQYGMFTSSTWQGFNITGIIHYVKKPEIQALVDKKVVTPLALIPRLLGPSVYYNYYHLTPKSGNDALDNLYKSSGSINFNNWIYPLASKESQSNTLKILVRYPGRYFMSVANEAYVFFGFFQYREFDNFKNWGSARVHTTLDKILFDITAYPLPLVMCLLFVSVVYWLVKKLKMGVNFKAEIPERQAEYVLIVFIFIVIMYTFGLAICAESGEANFLRVSIDPLFVSLAVLSVGGWLIKKFDWLKFLDK